MVIDEEVRETGELAASWMRRVDEERSKTVGSSEMPTISNESEAAETPVAGELMASALRMV